MESAYTDRIFELETKLEIEGKSFDDATNQYMTEFEKFKKEGQEYIEALNYEYQKKINNLEERLRVADYNKKVSIWQYSNFIVRTRDSTKPWLPTSWISIPN